MKMKIFTLICAITCAGAVEACDGVQALSGACYSQNLRQKIVVERQVEPVYVERQQIVVEKQYVPAERIVERQKVVVKRQRSARLRDAVQALTAPRASVRRERVVQSYSESATVGSVGRAFAH
jgi:hypothetical protein